MGCGLELDATDISQIDVARNSDVVILCVGEDMRDSEEPKSKAFLELSLAQKELKLPRQTKTVQWCSLQADRLY